MRSQGDVSVVWLIAMCSGLQISSALGLIKDFILLLVALVIQAVNTEHSAFCRSQGTVGCLFSFKVFLQAEPLENDLKVCIEYTINN